MIKDFYNEEQSIERALISSLYDLMQTIPIDRISVNEVVSHAHVSRASFYRRYKDKYDLLNKTYEDILETTLFRFRKSQTWRESTYQIYQVIYENHVFFANALHSQDENGFRKYLSDQAMSLEMETLRRHGVDPEEPYNYYRLVGYVSAGTAITERWVSRHCDLSLDELVDLLVELVPPEFREYFR